MYLKAFLLFFLSFKIYANSQIDDINNFLDAKRFSYEQVTENSTEVISGKLILDTLQIYLEIVSPYRESYLVSKNFITYNDIDFSQQRTFEYSENDFPIIRINWFDKMYKKLVLCLTNKLDNGQIFKMDCNSILNDWCRR